MLIWTASLPAPVAIRPIELQGKAQHVGSGTDAGTVRIDGKLALTPQASASPESPARAAVRARPAAARRAG
jgi:hypothetical protein